MSSQKLFLDIFNYSNGCTYDTAVSINNKLFQTNQNSNDIKEVFLVLVLPS
jgi:hypothetical protein